MVDKLWPSLVDGFVGLVAGIVLVSVLMFLRNFNPLSLENWRPLEIRLALVLVIVVAIWRHSSQYLGF